MVEMLRSLKIALCEGFSEGEPIPEESEEEEEDEALMIEDGVVSPVGLS